jgi:signal transduction histidine kinase
VLEPDGRLASMNQPGLRLMEIDNFDDFHDRSWPELWGQSRNLAASALASATTAGEARFQGLCPTAKGAAKWWDVIVTTIRDSEGQVAKIVCFSRDVTSQKEAEDERNQLLASERSARSEAERSARVKDEFLSTLSHELRTPLNAIVGWIGVLKQDQSHDTMVKAVDVIDRNSRRQSQMIDDLLDVSRIVSGKLRLDIQRVDLGSVIEEAVMSAQPGADAKGVRLVRILGNEPIVQGDPVRLQQVVWNLVSNAIKFSSRGGMVQVTLRQTGRAAAGQRQGARHRGRLLPCLSAVPPGDSSSTRRHGGLGLGLAIVEIWWRCTAAPSTPPARIGRVPCSP